MKLVHQINKLFEHVTEEEKHDHKRDKTYQGLEKTGWKNIHKDDKVAVYVHPGKAGHVVTITRHYIYHSKPSYVDPTQQDIHTLTHSQFPHNENELDWR